MKEKNRKMKIKAQQKQVLSLKMRLLIGTTCILLLASGIFIALNLTQVEKTLAGNTGDYRAIKNGAWEDADIWETFDGRNWQPAAGAPLHTGSAITVKSGIQLVINTSVTCEGMNVERGAQLILLSDFLTINKDGALPAVSIYGTLDAGKCAINGNAKFYLADNATLIIGSEKGISKGGNSGNIQVTGSRYFSSFANYVFRSSVFQQTGKGLPQSVGSLEIDNTAGIGMESDLVVSSLLKIRKGVLQTGKNVLTIGTGIAKCGTIERIAGGVQGNIVRWLGGNSMKEVAFPLVENENQNVMFMTAESASFQGGTFTFSFFEGKPEKKPKTDSDSRIISIGESGYYVLTAGNGLENGIYKLQSTISMSNHENKNYWLVKGHGINERKSEETVASATALFTDLTIGPNPFTQSFKINFGLAKVSEVEITMWSPSGQLVYKDKMSGQQLSNEYEFTGKQNLAPGTYYVSIKANNESVTKKIIKQ